MWLFTQDGFISIVAHRRKHDVALVRARDAESLLPLVTYSDSPDLPNEIARTPDADYPYRLEITWRQLSKYLVDQVYNITYDNFKNQVHDTRGDDFAAPLHKVWSAMHEVEDSNARQTQKRGKVAATMT